MKNLLIILLFVSLVNCISAQKYFTKTGHISFFSTTPIEDIEAHNYQVTSVIDFENGEIVFALLMKSFEFEKALMQEHFNEKYVESDEFPKANFKGLIVNYESVNLAKSGIYKVKIIGKLTMHGKTNNVEIQATIEVKDGHIVGESIFTIAISDYKIKIPSVVKNKIAKKLKISVNMNYSLYAK